MYSIGLGTEVAQIIPSYATELYGVRELQGSPGVECGVFTNCVGDVRPLFACQWCNVGILLVQGKNLFSKSL